MELVSWYAILGVALIVIAVGERFIVYKVLVEQGSCLPEKASKVANIASLFTVLVGALFIAGNFLVSRH